MHKATCGIYAAMRLVSDTPGPPFLGLVRFKGRVHGPCSSLSFKAQVKVTSTIEPPRAVIPAFLSSKSRRKAQALPSPSRFKAMAHLALVVVSGTYACMRSACTEALPGVAIQDSIFKFPRLKRANMTCNRYILKYRLCSAHMPDKSLSVVAGIYQCNPAISHNDYIHPLQEFLSSDLSLQTLGFKVLKAHQAIHIFLLDMQGYVDVAIPYPERQIGIYVGMGTAWFETF